MTDYPAHAILIHELENEPKQGLLKVIDIPALINEFLIMQQRISELGGLLKQYRDADSLSSRPIKQPKSGSLYDIK